MDIVALGRDANALQGTCTQVQGLGRRADICQLDLQCPAPTALEKLALLELDVFISNAAAFASLAPLEQVPPPEMERLLAVNVLAPLLLAKALIPGMKARRRGRMVFVGSIAGTFGAREQVVYATTKSALTAMVRSLAVELGRSTVTVNLVEPGVIETERVRSSIAPEYLQAIEKNTALGRAGRPEEVAAVIAFLCSPGADYITGATLPVSGGYGLGLGRA